MPKSKLKITVLMGGPSSEHEVSLSSGKQVCQNLDRNKYEVKEVIIPKSGKVRLPKNIEVAFIAMHGPFGEDGTIQGFLEASGVKYTGSGILASALAMNKLKTLDFLEKHGLKTAKRVCFVESEWGQSRNSIMINVEKKLGFPLVVKPCRSGSSVGVSLVRNKGGLDGALTRSFRDDKVVILEEYVKGTEVTCGVLDEGEGQNVLALPPLEIIAKKADFYDFKSKYSAGGSDHILLDAQPKTIGSVQDMAIKAHLALGCSGMSRTDMIIRGGKIYFLETNTIPGMTKTSLLPHAAQMTGISFPALLDRIIKAAIQRD